MLRSDVCTDRLCIGHIMTYVERLIPSLTWIFFKHKSRVDRLMTELPIQKASCPKERQSGKVRVTECDALNRISDKRNTTLSELDISCVCKRIRQLKCYECGNIVMISADRGCQGCARVVVLANATENDRHIKTPSSRNNLQLCTLICTNRQTSERDEESFTNELIGMNFAVNTAFTSEEHITNSTSLNENETNGDESFQSFEDCSEDVSLEVGSKQRCCFMSAFTGCFPPPRQHDDDTNLAQGSDRLRAVPTSTSPPHGHVTNADTQYGVEQELAIRCSCDGHWSSLNQTRQETAATGKDSDEDVVIVSALRTPITKAKRGNFKDTLPDDMLSAVFTATINRLGIDPTIIQDICIGNVMQPGSGANIGRIAQFFSDIPETVSLYTTNRQCSSGLQACANIAASIKSGFIDVGLAAGVESLTVNSMGGNMPGMVINPRAFDVDKARDTLMPMGITSENVAERFGVSREKQDRMAMESHQKAAVAQAKGYFDAEIIPVQTVVKDKDGNETPIVVDKDEGVRAGTTMDILGRLKPAFVKNGSTTAGNSSQVSDGAAAVLLARRSSAKKLGLPVLGVFRSFAVVGVPPDVMGIGPAYAIPEALKKAGLGVDDIDIYEINEAFASQAVYCVEKLGIPMEKVNPKGGAIALGHPLGCTGNRQVGTLLHELKRRGKRGYGVVSMCIGTGMGAAAVFEYPGN